MEKAEAEIYEGGFGQICSQCRGCVSWGRDGRGAEPLIETRRLGAGSVIPGDRHFIGDRGAGVFGSAI